MNNKRKKLKFAENETFANVLQPQFDEVFEKDHQLKGKWHSEYWDNNNPIVLELGCGKGEYSVNMAQFFPEKNFTGIDIKGARFWRGAKTATDEKIDNVAFIRTKIEFLHSFFDKDEVSEIWITFPDPQLKKRRAKKRLTSPRFLNMYRHIVKSGGTINLKTDSHELYSYTKFLLKHNNIIPTIATDNLYESEYINEVLEIKTHYEKMFLNEGKKINYIQFSLDPDQEIIDLPEEEHF